VKLFNLAYTTLFWFKLAYANQARDHSWNEPVLSNEDKVSCWRKQWGPLIRFRLIDTSSDYESYRKPLHQAGPQMI